MAPPEVAINAVSVVIRGAFNPVVFSPSWLKSQALIGGTELDAADIRIISPGITSFQADWLHCQVTGEVCVLATSEPEQFERVRDVAIGTLDALAYTPISVMGINREVHFRARTAKQRHAIGDLLAPKQYWNELVKDPATVDVSIVGIRRDLYAGRIQIQVQPSYRIQQGVFVAYNDHFDLEKLEAQPKSRDDGPNLTAAVEASADKTPVAIEILASVWEDSMARAETAIENVDNVGRE